MALDKTNFAPIGGQSSRGKAPAVYSYATLDAATTVDGSGYFNNLSDQLQVGDIINRVTWATAIGTGGTISSWGVHIVVSNASGVVDVTNTEAFTVSDAD